MESELTQCQVHLLEISVVASFHCKWFYDSVRSHTSDVTDEITCYHGNNFHELSNMEFKAID